MSANMVLASLCLAFVIVLAMIITAVAAYFLWHGAMFWAEQQQQRGAGGDSLHHGPGMFQPPQQQAHQASHMQPPQHHQDLPQGPFGSAQLAAAAAAAAAAAPQWPQPPHAAFHAAAGPCEVFAARRAGSAEELGGEGLTYRRTAAQRHPDLDDEPLEPLARGSSSAELAFPSPPARGRGRGAAQSRQEPPSPQATVTAHPSDLRRGYAAHLALKFGGDLVFHVDNVDVVTDVYNLEVEDLCYCFLCLEEVGNSENGAGLKLKKWGTGSFAARLWTTALARFIKSAQKQRGAMDDSRVEKACGQWQYQSEHFLRELLGCEVPFQRKFGRVLLEAFKDNDIRQSELHRARVTLAEHGLKAAPRNARLALAASAAEPGRELSLPALPSLEARPQRANARRMLMDTAEEAAPAPKRKSTGADKDKDKDNGAAAKKRRQSRG